MRKNLEKQKRTSKSQEGMALISAIFVILITTVIGFALYYSAIISFTIAVNDRDNTEAFYIADAGINHAIALINKVPKSQYSAILTAGANSAPDTGDELSVPPSSGLWTTSESIPAGSATSGGVTSFGAGGGGRYWVSVRNDTATGETATTDSNGILIITSTGVGRDGASATIEVIIQSSPGSLPAVLINGKAKISGSVSVKGTNGILHTNDTLQLAGNPCADQYFSTSADFINPGNLKGAGCSGAGVNRFNQPIIAPPIYNIRNDFYGKTDYTLGAAGTRAGKIYNALGVLVADATLTGNKWTVGSAQWVWYPSLGTWVQTGNSVLNASFYSEGNIGITGNFGSSLFPARVTFIAEGSIYNGGKQYLTPAYKNFTLVAGADLKISGKLTEVDVDDLELEGISYARDQIDFAGTPVINGTVIAANQSDADSPICGCNFVPLESGYMNLRGNPTIISDGTGSAIKVSILSWREVRY
jgi:Tfp pilus assembly protein PilX